MCRVRCTVAGEGASNEAIAVIETVEGHKEELIIPTHQIESDTVPASELQRQDGDKKVLVELPRETASGKWRVWVPAAAVQ